MKTTQIRTYLARNKNYIFIFLFFVTINNNAFSQSYTWVGENATAQTPLDLPSISAHQVFSLKTPAILNWLDHRQNRTDQLILRLPGLDTLAVVLYENPIVPSSYTLQVVTQNGTEQRSGPSRCITFAGYLATDPAKTARLTITDNFIFGSIKTDAGELFIEPVYSLPGSGKYIAYYTRDVVPGQGRCGVTDVQEKEAELLPEVLSGRPVAECYNVEIAIANAYEMYVRYGSVSTVEAHNIGVMNNVEGDYNGNPTTPLLQDIGFLIVTQYIPTLSTNPLDLALTSSLDVDVLLPNFATWGNGGGLGISYDMATCWLTRNTEYGGNPSVVGYAQVGAICNPAYSIIEDYNGSDPTGSGYGLRVVCSHEFGHNFSCAHDAAGSPYIMAPAVNNTSDWSSTSISSISTHILSRTCVARCQANFISAAYTTKESSESGIAPSGGTTCEMGYQTLQIPIRWSGNPATAPSVNVSAVGGTAIEGYDFDISTNSVNFSTTGGTTQTQNIELRIYKDFIDEGDETIQLQIDGGANTGYFDQTTVTITNDCGRNPTSVFLNTKTVINGTTSGLPVPFNASFSDSRSMYVVQASELTAQGFAAGDCITGMALEISSKTSTGSYSGFTVGLKHTSATLASSVFETSGFITAFTGNYTTNTGWTIIPFSSPFRWNGSNNIMVQICFDNSSPIGVDNVKCSATGWTSFKADNVGPGCSLVPNPSFSIYSYRPNTQFIKGFDMGSAITTTGSAYLKNGTTVHFYSPNDKYLVSIQQTGGSNAGCVEVTVDRAGTGRQTPTWMSAGNYVTDKTFLVTADNPGATYDITLYYAPTETSVWGAAASTLNILKTEGPVSTSTAATSIINETVTRSTYGPSNTHRAYKATFSGFSGFALTNATQAVFPVEWLQFEAVLKDKNALLTWETGLEMDNTGFEVQRSIDGRIFEKIGFVPASNSPTGKKYQFTDLHLAELSTAIVHYRIAQVDINDQVNLSPIRALALHKNAVTVTLWPNPGTELLYLEVASTQAQQAYTATILDMNGKTMLEQQGYLEAMGNHRVSIATGELPSGMYTVHFTSENGARRSLLWVKK